jgi:signal transduction histidine kinase
MRGALSQLREVRLPDALLAAVLGAIFVVGTTQAAAAQVPQRHELDLLAYLLVGVAAAALLVRQVWPFVTLAVTVAAVIVYLAVRYPYGPILLAMGIAMYSVAVRAPPKSSMVAGLAALGAVLVPDLVGPSPAELPLGIPWLIALRAGLLLPPWAAGVVVSSRRDLLAQARQVETRRRASEERLRMAREVHDVVGHGLSVINMHAGIALHVLDRRPEQARVALEAIKNASKEGLDELRATLAVYRSAADTGSSGHAPAAGVGDGSAARRPAPGLSQLDGLVASMGGSGLPVELTVTGEDGRLPASVDLAAYRIVQESLTNVLRHAGPATATVRVAYCPGEVVLEVTDDGRARAGGTAPNGGQGINGMRERAAGVGGTLQAGPRPEGGFRVLARLPLGG